MKDAQEGQSIFLYLLNSYDEAKFMELRRKEYKKINSLRPYPNRDKIYLEPQRNRQKLGEFRQEIFSKQLQCFILGSERLVKAFDEEVSIDFKWAYKLTSLKQMMETSWKADDLVVAVIKEGENIWYARQYKVVKEYRTW